MGLSSGGLGRYGIWAPARLWESRRIHPADDAACLEGLGFTALWTGNGPHAVQVVDSLLEATHSVTVVTGVLNVGSHPAAEVAAWANRVNAAHPGRLLVGLGGGWMSQDGRSPHEKLGAYLDEIAEAVPASSRLLGALGPRTMEVARQRAAGVHPFLVTPDHTRRARETLGEQMTLAPEQRVVLETDPETARATARADLAFYLSKPNYARSLLRLGFTSDDLSAGGSDHLVDALVGWGDADAVVRRINEHHEAGADHVAVQLLTPDTAVTAANRSLPPPALYRRLAEALGLARPVGVR